MGNFVEVKDVDSRAHCYSATATDGRCRVAFIIHTNSCLQFDPIAMKRQP